jgi:hypothetical protein
MYTYIMERTQIYLSREQATALDREARRRGTTRSHLIREAIEERYRTVRSKDERLEALRASAGVWADRSETGEEYVERMRSGRRLSDLYGREMGEDSNEE